MIYSKAKNTIIIYYYLLHQKILRWN